MELLVGTRGCNDSHLLPRVQYLVNHLTRYSPLYPHQRLLLLENNLIYIRQPHYYRLTIAIIL